METEKNIPACVGFIMDGNRRWAKERGLETLEGHKKGYETLESVLGRVREIGIAHIVCYAFSTENWNRSKEEVSYLMDLFRFAIKSIEEKYKDEDVNIRFIGQRDRFPSDIQEQMNSLENKAQPNPELTIWMALSYGGRAEIVEAVNKAVQREEEVTEESLGDMLWTKGMPDPDLIIRTGGEVRTSNFLPWQSVYSEWYFTETHWPDFSKEEFQEIVNTYAKRQRRNGK